MANGDPRAVVSTNRWAVLVGMTTAIALFMGAVGGLFWAPGVSDALGVESGVGGVIAFLGTTTVIAALPVVAKTGQEARFYDDEVELTGGALRILGGSTGYDDVDLVIRKSRIGDRVFGTATFEVVRYRGRNITMSYMRDPETIERGFAERVTPPTEQLRRVRHGEDESHFWGHWPEDEDPPEQPVVEQGHLEESLDVDLDDVDMDALAEAEGLDEFDDLGDLGDVAGDIGDGGDGGGDGGGGE